MAEPKGLGEQYRLPPRLSRTQLVKQAERLQAEKVEASLAPTVTSVTEKSPELVAFEKKLSSLPVEFQSAYAEGGVEGYNRAVDAYNTQIERERTLDWERAQIEQKAVDARLAAFKITPEEEFHLKEFEDAIAFAGDVKAKRATLPEDTDTATYWKSVDNVKQKLSLLQQAIDARKSYVAVGQDIPAETQEQLNLIQALTVSKVAPFVDLTTQTVDVPTALRVGIPHSEIMAVTGMNPAEVARVKRNIKQIEKWKSVGAKVQGIRAGDVSARESARKQLVNYINPDGTLRLLEAASAGVDASVIRDAGYDVSQEVYESVKSATAAASLPAYVTSRTLLAAQSNYIKAETAFSQMMDRIDSENPNLSRKQRAGLYTQQPEYYDYLNTRMDLEQKQVAADPVAHWKETLASAPEWVLKQGAKDYVPLASFAGNRVQQVAFEAIDNAVAYVRGYTYGGIAAVTALPLFFLGVATDPIGTVKGVGEGVWSSLVGASVFLSGRARTGTPEDARAAAYQLGSDVMTLSITALMLRGTYNLTPKAIRTPFEHAVKTVTAGEGGYIRLPGSSKAVVDQLRIQRAITDIQANDLVRSLDIILEAIADRNQVRLYDAAKGLKRVADGIGDQTLINYAEDIISYPRAYIEGLETIARNMKPEDLLRKIKESDRAASKANPKLKLKEITAEDVGLTGTQFAEFIKQRLGNADLTIEQFKESLKPKPKMDWKKEVQEMTDRFNRKLREEATKKQAAKERAFAESQVILSRLKEHINERIAKEKAEKAKRAAEMEELRQRWTKEAAAKYDPEYARKVGEINKEIREHLQQIKERAKQAEERVDVAKEATETAQKVGSETKVAVATELLEELEEQLKNALQEQTETETELEESVELLIALQTQFKEATELEEETATELGTGLEEVIKESVEELQRPGEETREDEGTAIITPRTPTEELPKEPPPPVVPKVPPIIPGIPAEPPTKEPPPSIVPPSSPITPEVPTKPPSKPPPPTVPEVPTKPPTREPPTREPPTIIRVKWIDGGKEAIRAKISPGSITWKQGWDWKFIPPPYRQPKPISLGGTPPLGAKTSGRTPAETLQVVGRIKAVVPHRVAVDLGWADVFIINGRRIEFSGGGVKTDVGQRISSPTQGMSVGDEGGLPTIKTPARVGTIRRSTIKKVVRKTPPRRSRKISSWDYMTTLKGYRF